MASPLRLHVFTKNGVNPNYQGFVLGVRRVAATEGAVVEHRYPHQPDSPAEQAVLVAQSIAEKPDAILFAPADDVAMRPSVQAMNAAGIPLVGFVNRMPGRFVTFVGADDEAMATAAATALVQSLGGQGDVVLIEGPETAPTSRDRGRGFRKVLAAHPGMRLLGALPGLYLQEPGRAAMATLLAQHPRIDGVLAGNDLMALGALEALDAAGRSALVVGNNGTTDAIEAIAAGRLLASMDFDGHKMGCAAAMAAFRHLRGEAVPPLLMLPAQVIHRGNHAAWLVPPEQRPVPSWAEIMGEDVA